MCTSHAKKDILVIGKTCTSHGKKDAEWDTALINSLIHCITRLLYLFMLSSRSKMPCILLTVMLLMQHGLVGFWSIFVNTIWSLQSDLQIATYGRYAVLNKTRPVFCCQRVSLSFMINKGCPCCSLYKFSTSCSQQGLASAVFSYFHEHTLIFMFWWPFPPQDTPPHIFSIGWFDEATCRVSATKQLNWAPIETLPATQQSLQCGAKSIPRDHKLAIHHKVDDLIYISLWYENWDIQDI